MKKNIKGLLLVMLGLLAMQQAQGISEARRMARKTAREERLLTEEATQDMLDDLKEQYAKATNVQEMGRLNRQILATQMRLDRQKEMSKRSAERRMVTPRPARPTTPPRRRPKRPTTPPQAMGVPFAPPPPGITEEVTLSVNTRALEDAYDTRVGNVSQKDAAKILESYSAFIETAKSNTPGIIDILTEQVVDVRDALNKKDEGGFPGSNKDWTEKNSTALREYFKHVHPFATQVFDDETDKSAKYKLAKAMYALFNEQKNTTKNAILRYFPKSNTAKKKTKEWLALWEQKKDGAIKAQTK